ncbi:Mur ligase family protein [Microbacterium sp. NPDC089698]|uniref:Mur ligase family protein n=1 Tax=Microbacterium sp. NPDC089698 TaxID=3364200 RepID=UPI00380BC377
MEGTDQHNTVLAYALEYGGLLIRPVIRPQGRPLISAVTGTNGKTTVASATMQLMNRIGWRAACYDSMGVTDVHGVLREANTYRSPDYFPELIDREFRTGAEAVSIEAFVGILADGLLDRVEVDVAVSTGFERDHLDVHGSIEAYWRAKLRLFEEHLRPDGVALILSGSAQSELVREAVRRRGARLVVVGDGGEVRLTELVEVAGSLVGQLVVGGNQFDVSLPTVHPVVANNLLLAAGAVMSAGGSPDEVADALTTVVPPPGRLEVIAEQNGVTAIVDTAHNPGALRAALQSVRTRTRGRVILVFGAGGESDRGKRPDMGALAEELADIVILTDDNPRRELPQQIRREVRIGAPNSIEIPDRRDAIRMAVWAARPGDSVLVAGRGDERFQLLAARRVPLDDREILQEEMTR